MKTIEYADANAFLADAGHYLEKKETENSLILGLAIRWKEAEKQALFLSVKQKEEILLLAMQTPGQKLLLSNGDPRALPYLIAHLKTPGRAFTIPGVIGARTLSKAFAELWQEKYEVIMRQLIYRLEKVQHPEDPPKGDLRLAQETDLDILVKWSMEFTQEAMGEVPNKGEVRTALIDKIHTQRLFIWDDQGPVSMAAVARPTRNGVSVNYVYTPSIHRKKGYASITVAALSQKMLEQGYQFCTLFADGDFPSSNKIYQAIGYFEVGRFFSIGFESLLD